jgi:hypothetical protein
MKCEICNQEVTLPHSHTGVSYYKDPEKTNEEITIKMLASLKEFYEHGREAGVKEEREKNKEKMKELLSIAWHNASESLEDLVKKI